MLLEATVHGEAHDCDVSKIMPAKNNLHCGVDIMNELMKEEEGMYKSKGLFGKDSNSYWQELRRSGGSLMGRGSRLSPHALCLNFSCKAKVIEL